MSDDTPKPTKGHVVWGDRGWQHVYFGFCPTKKAWRREMRLMGLKGEPYPEVDGRATTFNAKGKVCVIVTIRNSADATATIVEMAGMIAHEATHVWQKVRDHMGEDRPSIECEAHAVQAIFQDLFGAWYHTRGRH